MAKQVKANQWSFSIKGGGNKGCRSITEIKNSYTNSKAKDLLLDEGYDRARAVMYVLAGNKDLKTAIRNNEEKSIGQIRERISHITKVVVTMDEVYYKIKDSKGESRVCGGDYTKYLAKPVGFLKYLDLKSGLTEHKIQEMNREISQAKRTGDTYQVEMMTKMLEQEALRYSGLYRGRVRLDNPKGIFNVFTDKDVSFPKLEEIVFVNNKEASGYDLYKETATYIQENRLMGQRVQVKIIGNEKEEEYFKRFIDALGQSNFLPRLKSVYYGEKAIGVIGLDVVSNSILGEKVSLDEVFTKVYTKPKTAEEIRELEKAAERVQKELEQIYAKRAQLDKYCGVVLTFSQKISEVLVKGRVINDLVKVRIPIEEFNWGRFYSIPWVVRSLEQVLRTHKEIKAGEDSKSREGTELYIKAFKELKKELGIAEGDVYLDIVREVLPRDTRGESANNRTMKTLGWSVKSEDGLDQAIKEVKRMARVLGEYYIIVCGIPYSVASKFLLRYGHEAESFEMSTVFFPRLTGYGLLYQTPKMKEVVNKMYADYRRYEDVSKAYPETRALFELMSKGQPVEEEGMEEQIRGIEETLFYIFGDLLSYAKMPEGYITEAMYEDYAIELERRGGKHTIEELGYDD